MLVIVVAILATVVVVDTLLITVILHGFLSNESKYREAVRRRHTILDEVEVPFEDVVNGLDKLVPRAISAKKKLKLQFGKGKKSLVPIFTRKPDNSQLDLVESQLDEQLDDLKADEVAPAKEPGVPPAEAPAKEPGVPPAQTEVAEDKTLVKTA